MTVHESDPQPGYYLRQFVKGGMWLPARIWWAMAPRESCGDCYGYGVISKDGFKLVRHPVYLPCQTCKGTGEVPIADDELHCLIGDEPANPYEEWIWLAGNPITEAKYKLLLAQRTWDKSFDPAATADREPVDWLTTRPVFSKD